MEVGDQRMMTVVCPVSCFGQNAIKILNAPLPFLPDIPHMAEPMFEFYRASRPNSYSHHDPTTIPSPSSTTVTTCTAVFLSHQLHAPPPARTSQSRDEESGPSTALRLSLDLTHMPLPGCWHNCSGINISMFVTGEYKYVQSVELYGMYS